MFLAPPSRRPAAKAITKDNVSNTDQRKSGWSTEVKTSGLSSPRLRLTNNKSRVQGIPNWHEEIKKAADTRNWEEIRQCIERVQQMASNDSSGGKEFEFGNSKSSLGSFLSSDNSIQSFGNRADTKATFWTRLVKGRAPKNDDSYGLLGVDEEGRTPLHLVLKSCKDQAILLNIVNLEPAAAALTTSKGRLPLHFAVVHRHDWPVIASLIDAYPTGLSTLDSKRQSPLHYAMNIAARESTKTIPPRTYWMPISGEDDDEISFEDPVVEEVMRWQEEQTGRWAAVHWLLLSSATHPQSSLSVEGRQKPMLVEALLSAAPPAVISLLIGASVMNLPFENKVSVFAASTLYSCITRQYPLSILQSLASQLHVLVRGSSNKIDMRAIRDETGMGLVSAQYISCCFVQPRQGQNQEWLLSEEFHDALTECIVEGKIIDDNPALLDWWAKMEFLISFCWVSSSPSYRRKKKKSHGKEENLDPSAHPKSQLLHAALANSDTPPIVVSILLSFYPSSVNEKDRKTGALPLHVACMNREYIPRYFEKESTGLFSSQPTQSSLEIVFKADPTVTRKRFEGRTSLHLAIASGKHYDAIVHLIANDSDHHDGSCWHQLRYRDPKTFLFPFQLAAACPNKSDEDSFRWTCLARNKFSHGVWQGKSDREKASEILKVAEGEDLSRVDTIFRLLRLFPGVIRPGQLEICARVAARPTRQHVDDHAVTGKRFIAAGNIGIAANLKGATDQGRSCSSFQSTDSSSATDDSSFFKASMQPSSPSKKARPTSLTLLLSKSRKVSKRNDEFFECDASVLSSVDVLSTLTSTLHTLHTGKAEPKTTKDDNDESMTIQSMDGDDESDSDDNTSFDGFAEDSGIRSFSMTDFPEDETPVKNKSDNETIETSLVDSYVSFEIRRRPRKPKGISDLKSSTSTNTSDETPLSFRATNSKADDHDSELDSQRFAETQSKDNPESQLRREPTTKAVQCKKQAFMLEGNGGVGTQATKSPSDSLNMTSYDKCAPSDKLLGSFTAGSESEGLNFDEFQVPPKPNGRLGLNLSAESCVAVSKPSMTFDKKQMKWVETSTARNSPQTIEKKRSERIDPDATKRVVGIQAIPFMSRPPPRRMSKIMSKKGPSRQLMSCRFCDHGAVEVLMIPCKHLCICRRCSKSRPLIQECPVCSSAVTDRMLLLS